MDRAIELTREGFRALAEGRTEMPVRQKVEMADGDMLLKPCCLPGRGMTVKLVTTCAGNPDKGLPLVQGIVLLFDDVTGTPRAVIDAGQLTSIRTDAGGGLAAALLACPDSCSVAVIGAGVQARQQLLAAMTVRNINYVTVFDPSDEAVEILESEFGAMPNPPVITRTQRSDDGVADADIVITATTSPVPTFHGSVPRPGTHVNAIGAYRPDRRELDEDTMRRSYVVVDGMAAAGREAGEVLIPGITPDAEFGELVTGAKAGRTSKNEITVFKSVGMAIQDAVSACYVLEQAERLNVGKEVNLADIPVGPCLSNGLEFEAYMPEI